MRDLTSPRLIYLKGFLGAALASVGLILQTPTLRTALLTAVALWCAARFYYFAFYVIERYVDPTYRFAGLISAVRYILTHRPPAPRP